MNKSIEAALDHITKILTNRGETYTKDDQSAFAVFEDTATSMGMDVNDVFLIMIAMKMARLKQNITHRDSIVDIAGYAVLWDAYLRSENNV